MLTSKILRRIGFLLPIFGLIACFVIVLISPRLWEGFAWNPAAVRGILVFIASCSLSLLLLIASAVFARRENANTLRSKCKK